MNTEKEKFEIPQELDAKILQYAAEKRFPQFHWYRSWAVKVAALAVIGVGFACMDIFQPQQTAQPVLAAVEKEELNWNEFEEKMEFVNDEIFIEAQYLAQL